MGACDPPHHWGDKARGEKNGNSSMPFKEKWVVGICLPPTDLGRIIFGGLTQKYWGLSLYRPVDSEPCIDSGRTHLSEMRPTG